MRRKSVAPKFSPPGWQISLNLFLSRVHTHTADSLSHRRERKKCHGDIALLCALAHLDAGNKSRRIEMKNERFLFPLYSERAHIITII